MNRLRWSGDSGSSRPLIPNGGDLSSPTIPDPGVGDDDGARPHRLCHHGVSPDPHLLGAGEMVTGRLKKDTQNPTLNWTFFRFHDVPEPWKSTGETVTVLVTNLTPAFWTILRCWETEHENTTGEQGPATSEIEWRPVGFLLTYTIAESSGHGYFSRTTGASLPLYPFCILFSLSSVTGFIRARYALLGDYIETQLVFISLFSTSPYHAVVSHFQISEMDNNREKNPS